MSPAWRHVLRPWKIAQAVVANLFFGFPGRKLRVIGVTGTDGKTTTVHLIVAALESAGYTVGAISTIHFQVGTRRWVNTSKLTTPGPWALQRLLAHMVRAGCHFVVLECSSHRLDQGGLWGIPADVAVITNLTREHLDYHRDLADYASAKRRLFRALHHPPKVLPHRRNIDRGGRVPTVAVANLDDPRCVEMLEEPAELKIVYTLREPQSTDPVPRPVATVVTARLIASQPQARRSKLSVVRAGGREALLDLKLPGRFNLQNALAAIAVGVALGIELARITRELSAVERIPGRMDHVEKGQPFTVLIDYAVTPAAFAALYAEVSQLKAPSSKLIHVFGAAGGRDRGKRPLLGAIAGRNADLVILTDEDPYGEDPEQILDDIEAGLRKLPPSLRGGGPEGAPTKQSLGTVEEIASLPTVARNDERWYLRIRDRRLAIREALRRARSGDIVIITGKGAEETMAVGPQRLPWSDRRVIEEELATLGLG